MENELITDVINFFNRAFAENEPVKLHELLWSIDANHHLILNLEEINSAIELIGGVEKNVDGDVIRLNQLNAKKSDFIMEEDIAKAMKIYSDPLKR